MAQMAAQMARLDYSKKSNHRAHEAGTEVTKRCCRAYFSQRFLCKPSVNFVVLNYLQTASRQEL